MNPERWHRIEELFRTVADRPPAEREAHLTRVCGNDEELRREVLELLAHETADGFLEEPIKHAAFAVTNNSSDELLGQRIGSFRLIRLIGRGGMGTVYEAMRDDKQFDQRVALKLIKHGMDSDFVRQRFLRERQILAGLDHPHIARLLDGGATATGLPYFAMEFVSGEPITAYCQRLELSIEAKLKLFRDVCAAVAHAHQKLVVHRDLKPSNILVTPDGLPKLLDFGIAKLLTPDANESGSRTETAMRLMTPDYASPEQVRGGAITTATDVYALGIVLYELLTGERPYQFETYAPAAIERAICDTEAPRPSEAASRQHGATAKLARQLAGDLDNIVMMALRKEPQRRYPSVEKFSEDIRLYLEGLPVTARADTFTYRAGKFVRRHRVAVAAAALVLLSLLGGLFATAYAARQARAERDRANQAAATAEAVTQSLLAVFDFADPSKSRGNVITAKELLDQGAGQVVRDLKNQPLAQAKLLDTIGQLYHKIGVYDRSQQLLEEALELRQRTFGVRHADVAASLFHLAMLAFDRGDYAESERLYRQSLDMRRALLGQEHLDVADSLFGVGRVLVERGRLAEAEPLLREALAMRLKLLGEEHQDTAASLTGLGRLLSAAGKFGEAESVYRQSLSIKQKLFDDDHPSIATSLNNIAAMLQEQGNFDGAEAMFRKSLDMRRRLLTDEHPDTIVSMANLASALQDTHKLEEAEKLYREVLELRSKIFGKDHIKLTVTMSNLASLLAEKGEWAECETLHRRALAIRRREFGDDHSEVASSLYSIGTVIYHKGQYAEAERLQRQAIAILQKQFQPDHWMIHRSRSHLGACLIKLKHYDEAEKELLPAYAGLKTARGAEDALTRNAVSHLIALYEAWGKPDQAAPYRNLLHAKK